MSRVEGMERSAGPHGAGIAWPFIVLAVLLPLEPPGWTVHLLGLEITLLEMAAGLAMAAVAISLARQGRLVELRHSPFLGWAVAVLGACALSAFFAAPPRILPFKFTVRVAAGVTLFALASVALNKSGRVERFLASLAASGTGVALVGLAETLGVPGVDGLTSVFRDQDFEVGGSLRIAATFPYPNVAAGFLVLALPGALLWSIDKSVWTSVRAVALVSAWIMFGAVLLTYSRGALLGALFVPLPIWLWGRWHGQGSVQKQARWCLVSFLCLTSVAFGNESFRLRAVSEGDTTWYGADFTVREEELALQPGELTRTPVVVRNTGRMAWETQGEKQFHVSYRWFDLTTKNLIDLVRLEGERTALPERVVPGKSVEVLAHVRAPKAEGRYLLIWDMVQEHTTWFTEKHGRQEHVVVTVGCPETVPLKTPEDVTKGLVRASWRPGRLELWSLALHLFGQNPILGVGPDNFRWLYGPAAGRDLWDTRTFSNSLYLEILCTTGLVGTVCFLGLMTAAARALARGLRQERKSLVPAALAASLGGFLVHGVFDYLLEMTSIYLSFWLLLGALAAWLQSSGVDESSPREEMVL